MFDNRDESGVNGTLEKPSPEMVKEARLKAELSAAKAARLVGVAGTTWRGWETGTINPNAGLFELFLIKTGMIEVCMPDGDIQMRGSRKSVMTLMEASRYLRVPARFLNEGEGTYQGAPCPPFIKFSDGEKVFRRSDLIKWAKLYRNESSGDRVIVDQQIND